MGNMNMQNAILQAIDIISSKKVNFAKYDKTIQGVILQCVDATIGKYKVKYQDSIFIAYSENTSISYSKGTDVYILVPNSDMTKAKTIIGAVNRLGTNFIQNYDLQEKYNLIGTSITRATRNNWALCSYRANQIVNLYSYDNPADGSIRITTRIAQKYLKASDLLILSMNVRTILEQKQRRLGNYGLVVQADFYDQTAQSGQVIRSFVLNVDNFVGNPYLYTVDTLQKAVFEIDGSNFIRIRSIDLFSKDFPNQIASVRPSDIFISGLTIQGARAFSTDELNTSTLALTTPKGYVFDENDEGTDTRTIEASVRIKGKKADIESQGIDFYWFIEDASVTTLTPGYMKEAGQGWKCLNKYNEISDGLYEYVPSGNTYIIQKRKVFTEQFKVKCVAIYKDDKTIILSKETEIINYDAAYQISIRSNLGTKFYKDNGSPILTCKCFNNGEQIDIPGAKYVWSMVSSAGVFQSLSQFQPEVYTFQPSNGKNLQINVAKIINFATFKCSVFLPIEETLTFIGTGSIVISNSNVDVNDYFLIINNGNELFKYSTTGLSPASEQLEDPIELKALSFNLYDNHGDEIDTRLIERAKITWTIPIKNTMLKIVTDYEEPEDQEATTVDIEDIQQIVYEIKDTYSSYYTNNQIELTVNYNGKILKSKTNFTFLKEGESGTNGTDYTFKFVPDIQDGTLMPQYPTITFYDEDNYYYNWLKASQAIGKAELWHDGDLIYSSSVITGGNTTENKQFEVIECKTLYNKYSGDTYKDRIIFTPTIISSYYKLEIDASEILNEENFFTTAFSSTLKATARYENLDFISTMPICIGYLPSSTIGNNIFLKQGTGFNRVLYNSNGTKPMYDSRNPFEIEIIENGQILDDVALENFTFEWNCVGSVWNRENGDWVENSNQNYLTIKETEGLKFNQVLIKPINEFDGQCVTTALVCKVEKSQQLFGFLYIPIHMSLNRYQNSAINGWDGNSIELGGLQGGMILAPQVGAGIKNNNNTFTGIIMGTAKDPKQQTNNNTSYDIGLFGYHQGERSIFLDAKTGKAFFGTTGAGQIIIDPSTSQALLKSGNYVDNSNSGSGMLINLTTPEIRYGNRKFIVDENGVLTVVGAKISGDLRIDQGGRVIAPSGGWDSNGLWLGGNSFENGKFKVYDTDGSIYIRRGSIIIGPEPSNNDNNDDNNDNDNNNVIANNNIRSINNNNNELKSLDSFNSQLNFTITRDGNGSDDQVWYPDDDPIYGGNDVIYDNDEDYSDNDYSDFDTSSNSDVPLNSNDVEKSLPYVQINATDGLILRRGAISIGQNKNTENKYNFQATQNGNVIISKDLKIGFLKMQNNKAQYALQVNSQGRIRLNSQGSNSRFDLNPDGIISFKSINEDGSINTSAGTSKIEFKTTTVLVPNRNYGNHNAQGTETIEAPDCYPQTVTCLNFSSKILKLNGDVSVSKILTTHRIYNNGLITTRRLRMISKTYSGANDNLIGTTFLDFSSTGGTIGYERTKGYYEVNMQGALIMRKSLFSFYGCLVDNIDLGKKKALFNVYDEQDHHSAGLPVVGNAVFNIKLSQTAGIVNTITIQCNGGSERVITSNETDTFLVVKSITKPNANTLQCKRVQLTIRNGVIIGINHSDTYDQQISI